MLILQSDLTHTGFLVFALATKFCSSKIKLSSSCSDKNKLESFRSFVHFLCISISVTCVKRVSEQATPQDGTQCSYHFSKRKQRCRSYPLRGNILHRTPSKAILLFSCILASLSPKYTTSL